MILTTRGSVWSGVTGKKRLLFMYCPLCAFEDTKVLESRMVDEAMRRRRECLKCENRFTTYEKAVFNLTVIKKDGRQEEFDVGKITKSVEKACNKAEEEMLQELSRKIEQKILSKKINPIKTAEIGKIVMQELKKVDKMAYVRYASVYKNIEDVRLLEKEIELIV